MKNFTKLAFAALSLCLAFAACNSNKEMSSGDSTTTDTTVMMDSSSTMDTTVMDTTDTTQKM